MFSPERKKGPPIDPWADCTPSHHLYRFKAQIDAIVSVLSKDGILIQSRFVSKGYCHVELLTSDCHRVATIMTRVDEKDVCRVSEVVVTLFDLPLSSKSLFDTIFPGHVTYIEEKKKWQW